jgi:hypothetical protein
MNKLKLTLFWTTLYLAVIFIFGLADNVNRPIINFASYFYIAVLVAFPVTLFFPSISKAPLYIPMLIWGAIYMVILRVVDRSASTQSVEYAVIVLEFILLELGVWLAYRLAAQISQAESFLEALALGAFPSRARGMEQEQPRIKMEFSRSRRYDRPLSLIVMESDPRDDGSTRELLKNIQDDLLHSFKSARLGQIIDEYTRQTDLILKDYRGRFVILCPETNNQNVLVLAERLAQMVRERTDLHILWAVASFPIDALSFEDLVQHATKQLNGSASVPGQQLAAADAK